MAIHRDIGKNSSMHHSFKMKDSRNFLRERTREYLTHGLPESKAQCHRCSGQAEGRHILCRHRMRLDIHIQVKIVGGEQRLSGLLPLVIATLRSAMARLEHIAIVPFDSITCQGNTNYLPNPQVPSSYGGSISAPSNSGYSITSLPMHYDQGRARCQRGASRHAS